MAAGPASLVRAMLLGLEPLRFGLAGLESWARGVKGGFGTRCLGGCRFGVATPLNAHTAERDELGVGLPCVLVDELLQV